MSNIDTPKPGTRPGSIDLLQMLRDAQGEAHEVTKAQVHLKEAMDEEMAHVMKHNPTIALMQDMLDQIRVLADEAAKLPGVPQPYAFILRQVAHWIDVADDAFKAL